MKKNKKIVIFIVIILIIILLVWYFLNSKKDFVFNIKTNNIEVKIGESIKIDYEIKKEVTINWISDNDNIVSVNNGVVTGIGFGNTIVHGIVTDDNKTIIKDIYVSTYGGNKNSILNEIIVTDGILFITNGTEYEIDYNYNPNDAYITSVEYSSMDENIATYSSGKVKANNIGTTNITLTMNKKIDRIITVNVIEREITPTFSSKVESVDVTDEEIVIKPNETKEILYTVTPEDGFIESIEWTSSDENIVTANDGIITSKSSGEATIFLTINGNIKKEIKVIVSIPVSGISLKSREKIVLKVGNSENIKTSISPTNATNKKINYSSSSNNIVIDGSGKVTGASPGTGTITIKTEDGSHKIEIPYVVNPRVGVVNGDGGIWGYSQSTDKVLDRMDITFFQKLASNGKGTLSGSIYTYTDSKHSYKYDISSSSMSADDKKYLMRIYYPANADLSEVNTLTFFGGSGERKMRGYFSHLDSNRNELVSSGIVILVSTTSSEGSYHEQYGIISTEFVQSIVGQKEGVKNAVAGYSMGGDASGRAANTGIYDRLILFETGFNANNTTNVKDMEILVYKPTGKDMLSPALNALNGMFRNKYTNVTVISNNTSSIVENSNYSSNFLIINPGRNLGSGHGHINISNAKVFSYACS